MLTPSENDQAPVRTPAATVYWRLIPAILLLGVAVLYTERTIEGLQARRNLRTELAEISHARFGLLDADRWVNQIVPILNAKVDALDLTAEDVKSLKGTVEQALYRLLDDVKAKMSAPKPASTPSAPPAGQAPASTASSGQAPAAPAPAAPPPSGGLGGGLAGMLQGNPLIANMMVGALRPHVPEYADVVLAELSRPANKQAFRNYLKGVLATGAKNTFSPVDKRWYNQILKQHGCADAAACQQELGHEISAMDADLTVDYLLVLGASALAFLLVMVGRGALGRLEVVVLLAFCIVLLLGGVLTPMLEVEAKLSRVSITFLGDPVTFSDQVLYFQSKSVLEVFHTLITMGRPEMWVVGVLVLMFSIVFPTLKVFTLGFCLQWPRLLRNRVAHFLALESSKWSMADVMALAIFMSFVAFNGLIANSMAGLRDTGAQVVIPTDSSKTLPGYYLFIGFCLASLFLSKKLERGIRTT